MRIRTGVVAASALAVLVPASPAHTASTGANVVVVTGSGSEGSFGYRSMLGTGTTVGSHGVLATYPCEFAMAGSGTQGTFQGSCGPMVWEPCLYASAERTIAIVIVCSGLPSGAGTGSIVFAPTGGPSFSFTGVLTSLGT